MGRAHTAFTRFHVHGLIGGALASLAAGASIVCPAKFSAAAFFEWIDTFHPTWYTAVPTMHEAVLRRAAHHRDVIARSSLRVIRSCSAPLPPRLMAELENALGVPVVEAYGMTEAAHQIASNPLPPGKRVPGSVGLPAGPDVAILDEAGTILAPGRRGEIAIRGASVMSAYAGDPDATRAAFTGGWFRTGDQGYLDDEGCVFISGRLKEMINRAGEKIAPREVEEVLLEHPSVLGSAAFPIPDARLGEDVGAAVVLRENASATERQLREFAWSRLADHKVPRRVVIVDALPQGPTGKVQRLGLAEHLGVGAERDDSAAANPLFVAPRTPVERTLAEIAANLLELPTVGVHDNFFYLGGDSLLATEFLVCVQDALGVDVSALDFFEAPTVARLAVKIDGEAPAPSPLVAVQPGGSRRPFFFLHAARDGGGFYCFELARALGNDQPFYALAPHRLIAGNSRRTVETMAAAYLQAVRAVEPSGPYYLGGFSATAVVAFEMARQLMAQGEQVGLLALIEPRGRNLHATARVAAAALRSFAYLLSRRPDEFVVVVRDRCDRIHAGRRHYVRRVRELLGSRRGEAGRLTWRDVRTRLASAVAQTATQRSRTPAGDRAPRPVTRPPQETTRATVAAHYRARPRRLYPATLCWPPRVFPGRGGNRSEVLRSSAVARRRGRVGGPDDSWRPQYLRDAPCGGARRPAEGIAAATGALIVDRGTVAPRPAPLRYDRVAAKPRGRPT